MMIDYNNILVEFMFEKARVIHKVIEVPCDLYFTKDDAIYLYTKVSNERAKEICYMIRDILGSHRLNDTLLCPFCIITLEEYDFDISIINCKECAYGKKHGICVVRDSDYYKITGTTNQYSNISSIINPYHLDLLHIFEFEKEKQYG